MTKENARPDAAAGNNLPCTGTEEFIVGGAVRDLLLGRTPRETDVAFTGTVEGFICRNPSARKAGNDFPICILGGVEFAPLRDGNIFTDLLKRDFTMNALALEQTGRIFAHPHAFEDLRNKVIRTASTTSLHDDPVRVFRAARFAATFADFTIHEDTLGQMRAVAAEGRLLSATPERVCGEILKALETPAPGQFLRVLAQGQCLSPWFAELAGADTIPAGPLPYHRENVLEHTAQVMDRCAGNPAAAYMALCHDLGKMLTPADMLPRHHGHDATGEEAATRLGIRLKLPGKLIRAGALAARHHMKGANYKALRPGTRVDMLSALGSSQLPAFAALVLADSGEAVTRRMEHDMKTILAVRLPDHLHNLGPESGARLRELRCAALLRHDQIA
ncbi:HD domain-containing protein [Desulfovibrio psychrotolerans]|uniref:tRNA nucleotidyltransferase n=1 Tax=Desulfovibrio psychrotolerans TaxID=415242 RepID=A0A7J0BQJ6_9BACT|nr:HD domain-containing protein [Desulfovibrio psychrotolerans]GFM35452.1 tRNA nucleotidyltransferase [Desulfovibrio psychrotolerans]